MWIEILNTVIKVLFFGVELKIKAFKAVFRLRRLYKM